MSLILAGTICASLSLIGDLSILALYKAEPDQMQARKQDTHHTYFRLICWLAMVDVISAVGDLLIPAFGDHTAEEWPDEFSRLQYGICLASALMTNFGDLCGIFWIGCITHYVYVTISSIDYDRDHIHRLEKIYIVLCPLLSLIITGLPFLTGHGDVYGFDGYWCWLRVDANPHWKFTIFYAELWLTDLIIMIYIVAILRIISKHLGRVDRSGALRLMIYPAIHAVAWGAGSARRVYLVFHSDSPSEWATAQHILNSSNGLLVALGFIYLLRPAFCVRKKNELANRLSMSKPRTPKSRPSLTHVTADC